MGYFSIASLALNSMMARFITIERERGNIGKAQAYFSSGFYANIIMAVFFLIPMGLFVYNIDAVLNVPENIVGDVRLLFFYVFFAMLIGLATTAYGVSVFAANRLDLRALGELVRGVLRITLFVLLFYFLEPSLYIIGLVSFLLSIYLFFYNRYLTRRLTPELTISLSHFDLLSIKTLLFSGGWNVVNAIGMSLLLGMTLILTNKFIGVSEGGEVAVATMLPTFVGSIITMIVSVLLPRLTQVYATDDKKRFCSELVFSQKLLSLLTTTPILLLFVFSDSFFKLWIPNSYTESVFQLSWILLIPLFVHANMWTVYNFSIITNRLKQPSLALLIVGIICVICSVVYVSLGGRNVLVIPLITTVVSVLYYLFYIPLYVVGNSDITVTDIYSSILRTLFYIVPYMAFIRFFVYYWPVSSWMDLSLLFVPSGLIGLVFHFLCIFSVKDLKKLKRA